ncbi:hypothetical protein AAY473_023074 [Plecturocebus cupreus]
MSHRTQPQVVFLNSACTKVWDIHSTNMYQAPSSAYPGLGLGPLWGPGGVASALGATAERGRLKSLFPHTVEENASAGAQSVLDTSHPGRMGAGKGPPGCPGMRALGGDGVSAGAEASFEASSRGKGPTSTTADCPKGRLALAPAGTRAPAHPTLTGSFGPGVHTASSLEPSPVLAPASAMPPLPNDAITTQVSHAACLDRSQTDRGPGPAPPRVCLVTLG